MAKIIWILVLFLGLPAAIYFLLNDAITDQEGIWYREVLKDLPADKQLQFNLHAVCENPTILSKTEGLSDVCRPYRNTNRLRFIALAAAVIPIIYALLLFILSRKCRSDRTLLFRVFRPGVYMSSFFVAGLILLQWFLISGVTYGYAFGQLRGDQYFWILPLGCVALVGAFFTVRPILFGVPKASTTVIGLAAPEDKNPTIWRFIRDLADRAGAKAPDHLIVGFSPNFFVTEASVVCGSGKFNGATMYLSLPLCRILTSEELAAVILHELAHFRGEDAKFTIHFYPIYRGISDSIHGVSNASSQVIQIGSFIPFAGFKLIAVAIGLSLLPSVYLLSFFLDAFSRAENQIGRDRELAADGLAAQIESPTAIASVLVKMSAYTFIWNQVLQWARESHSKGTVSASGQSYNPNEVFFNMSEIFSNVAIDSATPDILTNLDSVKTPHPTDTHPPLSVRLHSLNTNVESIAPHALLVKHDNPSSNLFDDLHHLETEISALQWKLA
jgi:Zn-dependent protease with chaperone function